MQTWIAALVTLAGLTSLILAYFGANHLDHDRIRNAKAVGHRAFWIALPTTLGLSWTWWTHAPTHTLLIIDSVVALLTWSGLNQIRQRLRDIGFRFW